MDRLCDARGYEGDAKRSGRLTFISCSSVRRKCLKNSGSFRKRSSSSGVKLTVHYQIRARCAREGKRRTVFRRRAVAVQEFGERVAEEWHREPRLPADVVDDLRHARLERGHELQRARSLKVLLSGDESTDDGKSSPRR